LLGITGLSNTYLFPPVLSFNFNNIFLTFSFIGIFLIIITIALLSVLILICYTTLPLYAQFSVEEYFYSGVEKVEAGDYEGAIKEFDKAIEINPKDARAYNGRGVSKIFLGQKDSGCLDLTKAMELGEPHHAIKQFCNP